MADRSAAVARDARRHLTQSTASGAFAARMGAPSAYDPNRFTRLFTGRRGAVYYTHLGTGKKVYLSRSQKERCIRTPENAPVSLLPGDVNNQCRFVREDTRPGVVRRARRRFDPEQGRWIQGYGGAVMDNAAAEAAAAVPHDAQAAAAAAAQEGAAAPPAA